MITLQIDTSQLKAFEDALRKAPAETQRILRQTMTRASLHMMAEVSRASPVGVTSVLQSSWAYSVSEKPDGVEGAIFVGPSAPHALFVEEGTRPHWAPLPPLILWVRKVLGVSDKEAPRVARAVQVGIARKGTRAQKFAAKTLAAEQGRIDAMFRNAVSRITKQVAKG